MAFFPAILKQVMEEFSTTAVSFSMPLNQTSTDRSEGSDFWFPSIMCIPCHSKNKNTSILRTSFGHTLKAINIFEMAKTFLSSKTLTVLLNLFPLCRWHTQKIESLYGEMEQMAAQRSLPPSRCSMDGREMCRDTSNPFRYEG